MDKQNTQKNTQFFYVYIIQHRLKQKKKKKRKKGKSSHCFIYNKKQDILKSYKKKTRRTNVHMIHIHHAKTRTLCSHPPYIIGHCKTWLIHVIEILNEDQGHREWYKTNLSYNNCNCHAMVVFFFYLSSQKSQSNIVSLQHQSNKTK